MQQAKLRWIALAIVLPALLFRALIPIGFMPMAGMDGSFRLGLCAGTVDGATFIAALADPHAQHQHHDERRSPPACPYALSGTPLPATALAAPEPPAAVEQPLASFKIQTFLPTIARVQQPRGPPVAA